MSEQTCATCASLKEEVARLREELDDWRRLHSLQTSSGWLSPQKAAELRDETYRTIGKQVKADADALRAALTSIRWVRVQCGACGVVYRQCRGCDVGTLYVGTDIGTDKQCGGHPATPCKQDCAVDAALTSGSRTPEPPQPQEINEDEWNRLPAWVREFVIAESVSSHIAVHGSLLRLQRRALEAVTPQPAPDAPEPPQEPK